MKGQSEETDRWQMHVRHKNLLSKANFLQTRAEPKLVRTISGEEESSAD